MAATQLQIDTYITDIRSAVADYGKALAVQQEIGNHDTHCGRLKLILLSVYLDCIYDYFLQYGTNIDNSEADPSVYNFFTTAEIRDIMQHMNTIMKTFYIINLD